MILAHAEADVAFLSRLQPENFFQRFSRDGIVVGFVGLAILMAGLMMVVQRKSRKQATA